MCLKCLRKAKRLGHKPLKFGQVKYFAHQFMMPWISSGNMCLHRPIPHFRSCGANAAIEGHMYKIRRKKTNKNIYNRKRKC